jgi:hypothetical protein
LLEKGHAALDRLIGDDLAGGRLALSRLPLEADVVHEPVVQRVLAARDRDLVGQYLESEMAERRSEAPERAAGGPVRVGGRAFEAGVRARVQIERALADAPSHAHAGRDIGARVHRRLHQHGERRAVAVDADRDVDVRLLAVAAGDELFFAAVLDAHRTSGPPRQQRRERGEPPFVLVAESAAHRRADHAHVLDRHTGNP